MSEQLTIEQFQKCLPKQLGKSVNQDILDGINKLIQQPELSQNYRDNVLSYTSVMLEGKYKITDYLNAVAYISHKLLGSSNVVAYCKTFPERYQRLLNKNTSDKDISSYVAAYNKTKLVNLIFEQTLVPTHVLNADMYQEGLNILLKEAKTARADMARVTAAGKLVDALKVPESTKIELDVSVREDKTISDLKATMAEHAMAEKRSIELGLKTVKEVAHSTIIEGETCG